MVFNSRRMRFVRIVFFLLFVVAAGRLFQIQIVQGGCFRRNSLGTLFRCEVPARRGTIFDRNGRVLATDVEAYTIYVDRRMINSIESLGNALERAGIVSKKKFAERLNGTKARIVTIARGVKREDYEKVKKIKGIFGVRGWWRFYPLGHTASTVIGKLNAERKGIAGIEAMYDEFLRGKDGFATFLLNLRNSEYRYILYPAGGNRDPVPGKDLRLTLDLDLLNILDNVSRKILKKTKADRVLSVVVDAVTGEILGVSNVPELGETDGWVRNDLVQKEFEPGSIFKLIPAAAYIETGKPLDRVVADRNEVKKFGKKVLKDERSHPPYNFVDAVAHSSNVGFANIGLELGASRIYKTAINFGLFTRTGVTLPGEAQGVPMKKWYRYPVNLAIASFGQGFKVTPIQMVYAYGAVGNNGKLMKPIIVLEILDNGRVVKKAKVKVIRPVLEPEVNETLVQVLREVVIRGTGKLARVEGLDIIGKTGTGQQSTSEGYKQERYVSSFIGVVNPGNAPVVIGIFIDNPKGEHKASIVACPGFKEIVKRMMNLPQYRIRFLREVAYGG